MKKFTLFMENCHYKKKLGKVKRYMKKLTFKSKITYRSKKNLQNLNRKI